MRLMNSLVKEKAVRLRFHPRNIASQNVVVLASAPNSQGQVTWTFTNVSQKQFSVILFRGAQNVSPYYFGNSFWPVYNQAEGIPFATNLSPLGGNLFGASFQSAPLGLIHFAGQAYMVAFVYTLGSGEQWSTTEEGFTAANGAPDSYWCTEVTLETAGNFAITYDPQLVAAADSTLGSNGAGYSPDPNIFQTVSCIPAANAPYIENWVMSYAQPTGGASQWEPWESLSAPPGQTISGPAACTWGQWRVDVFVTGSSDSALWHVWSDDDAVFQGWEPLSGNLSSDPAAVCWGPGTIDVFGRGPDMALWHIWYHQPQSASSGGDSQWWKEWTSLSAPGVAAWNGVPISTGHGDWQQLSPSPGFGLLSKPAAISWGPELLVVYVYAVTPDSGAMQLWFLNYNKTTSSGGWATNWELFPLQPPDIAPGSSPCAASWGNGRTDILVMGLTGLWHIWFDFGIGGWAPAWENLLTLSGVTAPLLTDLDPLDVGFQNSPAMSSWGIGRLDVFLRSAPYGRLSGADCALWHLWANQGQWQGWETLGGRITSDPGAASGAVPGINGIDVFTRGNDLNLWHLSFG